MKEKKPTQREKARYKILSQHIQQQMREISKRRHEERYIRAIEKASALFGKTGALSPDIKTSPSMNEKLLRGWKEICPAMNVADRRVARKKLADKGLLRYEDRRPVLFISEYLDTLRMNK